MKKVLLNLMWMWVLSLGLIGCASKGPTTPEHLVSAVDAQKLGYNLLWATDLVVPAGAELADLKIMDEAILTVEHPSNIISAISVKDGHLMWRQLVSGGQDYILGSNRRNKSFLINSENTLYELEVSSGRQVNSSTLSQTVAGSPAVVDEYAVFGGVNGTVFAHDVLAGFAKWSYQLTDRVAYQPLVQNNVVYAVDRNGVILALTADAGKPLWRRQPTDVITSQPLVTQTTLYITTIENKIHAIDRTTGRDRWVYRSDVSLTPQTTLIGTTLLQPMKNGQWLALDAATGQVLWKIDGGFHSVARAKQGWLLASHDQLVLIDPGNGRKISSVTTVPTRTMLAGPDQSVILIGTDGRVLRLDPAM